jgi:hypothetical protein
MTKDDNTTKQQNNITITTVWQYINMTIHKDNNTTKQQYNITTIQQYINRTINKDDNTKKQQYNITTIQQHASSCYIITAMMYGASIVTF